MTLLHQLPHEIIGDILCRLPFEYAIPCKEVCRTWRILLCHVKHDQKVNLLFAHKKRYDGLRLYYGEYDEKDNKTPGKSLSFNTLTRLGNAPVYCSEKYYHPIVGTHRGLVCFLEIHNKVEDPIIICNPFTHETVFLPYLPLPKDATDDFLVSGFGYLYATNEYKVVRIHYNPKRFQGGQVQVYTLGDKIGWRNNGITNRSLSTSNGIFCGGALHWIDASGTEIVAFDLADEKFRSVRLPFIFPLENSDDSAELLLLRGNLSFLVRHSRKSSIWSLKGDTKKKSDCKVRWRNEFTIVHSKKDLYHPVALTEENKVLMLKEQKSEHPVRENSLCRYDPKTATLEEFKYRNYAEIFQIFQAIPYMKSDVSLAVLEPDLPVVNWDLWNPNPPLDHDNYSDFDEDSGDSSDYEEHSDDYIGYMSDYSYLM